MIVILTSRNGGIKATVQGISGISTSIKVDRSGYIEMVEVAPALRHRGIATAMMNAVLSHYDALNKPTTLWATRFAEMDEDDLFTWYEKFGYQSIHHSDKYTMTRYPHADSAYNTLYTAIIDQTEL